MSSGANKPEDEQFQSEDGLKQIVDLLKFTIALATGSLVFSAALLTEDIKLNCWAKCCLFLSWLALATSAAAGALAYMRIPMLIAKRDFNMRDKFMEIPGRIHHISFVIGILSLGVALVIALIKK
jgi:hypothetical protein